MPSILQGKPRTITPAATTMPTAIPNTETRISSKALDLLGCYVQTFDKVVYEIAEEFARDRQSDLIARGEPVRIDIEDIQKAAEMFTDSVREQFGESAEHRDFLKAVEGMHACLKKRCQIPVSNQPR